MLDFAFDNFSAAKVDIFFQTAKSFSHFFSIWHKLFVFAAIFFEENKKVGGSMLSQRWPPLQTSNNQK